MIEVTCGRRLHIRRTGKADSTIVPVDFCQALLSRQGESTRRLAAQHLTTILGQPISFDPAADPATRERQIEQLQARIEGEGSTGGHYVRCSVHRRIVRRFRFLLSIWLSAVNPILSERPGAESPGLELTDPALGLCPGGRSPRAFGRSPRGVLMGAKGIRRTRPLHMANRPILTDPSAS